MARQTDIRGGKEASGPEVPAVASLSPAPSEGEWSRGRVSGGGGGGGGGFAAGELTDEELVQRMRGGEAAAGETLCRRYHASLIRYLQRISRSEVTAEELFQQTWLSVMEHLDRFDPAASSGGFKAWLFRIATNKATDVWRAHGRHRAAIEGLSRMTAVEERPASARMESTEEVNRLRRAIERLPESQRQVLMLRYYSGMKFVDIARTLGCPLNTALGRMHKAVLKLKAAMEGDRSAVLREGSG